MCPDAPEAAASILTADQTARAEACRIARDLLVKLGRVGHPHPSAAAEVARLADYILSGERDTASGRSEWTARR